MRMHEESQLERNPKLLVSEILRCAKDGRFPAVLRNGHFLPEFGLAHNRPASQFHSHRICPRLRDAALAHLMKVNL